MQCTFVAEENLVSLQVVPPQYGDTTNQIIKNDLNNTSNTCFNACNLEVG